MIMWQYQYKTSALDFKIVFSISMKTQCFKKQRLQNVSLRNQTSPTTETALVVIKWNKTNIPSPTPLTSPTDQTMQGQEALPSEPAWVLSSVYRPSNVSDFAEAAKRVLLCSCVKTNVPHITNNFRTRKTNLTECWVCQLPTVLSLSQ